MMGDWIGRNTEEYPLDDEEQETDAADRDRQIGDADRKEREVGDRVVPGHFDQPLAPDDHEQRDQGHQELHEDVGCALQTGVVDGAENNAPSYVFSNHYTVAKYYSLTQHLVIPEVLTFSKKAWATLSADDQALVKKFAREAQLEERELWNKYEQLAIDKAKAAGCEIIEIPDKTPFQKAVKPVWDKYGPKYQDMINRIQAIT